MKINIPHYVTNLLDILEKNGFEAYIVGGCVRDFLLGEIPHDYDVCTNCLPEKMKEVFKDFHLIETGIKHGTVTVMSEHNPVEITTYRSDGEYTDHRRPDKVTFETNLSEDLKRRDFTVNALCMNKSGELTDLFGGKNDLRNCVIKCVGEPQKRFDEDALRIMRGLRFSSTLGFEVEDYTAKAMREQKELLKAISSERIFVELKKLLCGKNAGKILLEYREIFAVIIPELEPCFDFPQTCPHHCYDVYEHICHSIDNIQPDETLRLVMLFHDIAKPELMTQDDDGVMHFKKHQFASADKSIEILRRLKSDKKTEDKVFSLIWEHDNRVSTRKAVKRLISKYGYDFFDDYLKVRHADTMAQSDFHRDEKLFQLCDIEKIANLLKEEDACLKLSDLAVNGNDIISMGYSGHEIKAVLQFALDSVINEEIQNDKEKIAEHIKEHFNESI